MITMCDNSNTKLLTGAISLERESVIKSDNLIDLGIGGLLFCCTCFSNSIVVTVLSLALMAVFMVHLLFARIDYYFKYLHFIFGVTAAITGCAVIEFYDIELTELDSHSCYVGAIPLMVFSYWVFLMTVKLYDSWFKSHASRNYRICIDIGGSSLREMTNRRSTYIIGVIGLLLICFVFMKVFDNPSFVLGIDRFEYDKLFDNGELYDISLKLIKYLVIPCIVIALYYRSVLGWSALAIYCLYAFWVGNKFGIFFSLLCCITMIYSEKLAFRSEQLGNNKQSVAVVVVAVISLIGVALLAASFTTQDGLMDYFSSRIAQQGQLWWKTYALSDEWHAGDFQNEIAAVTDSARGIADNVGSQHGIYKIMYYTSPKSIIDAKLATGSRYTEAGFAAAYYYFGGVGTTVFAIIGGLLTGLSVNLFLSYLKMNQIIRALLCLRLFFMTTDLMSNFLFAGFFSIVSIMTYLLLILGKDYLIRYSR